MKKTLISIILLLVALGMGLWLLVRRGPTEGPPAESSAIFKIEAFGAGFVIQYADGQTPLRALRWLPPLPDGVLPLQLLTQSDRQRLVLFQDGAMIANLIVPRPMGVREGFFNFAELHDAVVLSGDVAVLLYRSADASAGELPLIIAMDLSTQAPRWAHRAPGERLALGGDAKDGAVFLFGSASPILRLPLALQKGEKVTSTPFRPGLKSLDMPEEIKGLGDLLPTGSWSFLVAHTGGLSSYSENKGWHHEPMPSAPELAFPDAHPVLAKCGKNYWWQPFPGELLQVKVDGTPSMFFDATALAPVEPWSRDGALLKLRGSDPGGNLWFTLATPAVPPTLATPVAPQPEPKDGSAAMEPGSKGWKAEGVPAEPPAVPAEDWSTYTSKGLERVYRWNPEHRTLHGRSLGEIWAALTLPAGVNRPMGLPLSRPESGKLLLESGPTAWLLPLEALPLSPVGSTSKGQVR